MDSKNVPPPPPPQFRNTKILSDEQSIHLLLPQEIIEEILAILPVKSLLRFKCVSKAWRRLIGSDRFIKIQLQKSRDDTTFAHWRVIFRCPEGVGVLKQCSMRSFLDELSIDPSPIEDPTNDNHLISGIIVDSCNGVVCIFKEIGFFVLFNPATRIYHPLPKLDNTRYTHGFGWDETSDAYKVFALARDEHNYSRLGRVYSTKTNSWKTVEHEFLPSARGYGSGKFTCGKTHWLAKSPLGCRIESFDLKSEEFGVIELPFKPKPHTWLIETEECLGVASYNMETRLYEVWVMKEYGVKETWVKETRLAPHTGIANCYGSHFYFESLVSPIPDNNL